ncbi:MAG: NAD-dependent epimerase/dehydratase family protein [bacterium]
MNILVLGGTGFVGRTITKHLSEIQGVEVRIGARRPGIVDGHSCIRLDATDKESLTSALSDVDVVVNCITGSANIIRDSAAVIVNAANSIGRSIKLIHMSSMAVYGRSQGVLDEKAPLSDDGNWYGKAKIDAEHSLTRYAENGGSSTILRIGCVIGENSALWVDRIGQLIKSGRLGDLGHMGDGWSNLVHVNDVAKAVVLSINHREPVASVYNLSAPDSPRWNYYFKDFALHLGCVPLRYKTPLSMAVESRLVAPPLKALERLSDKGWIKAPQIPCIPPSLLYLWSQQIKLDSSLITHELGLKWTPYETALIDGESYFKRKFGNEHAMD